MALRGMRILLEQRNCRHDHAGCAVSALQGILAKKCLLDRMELVAFCQTFNCRYLLLPDRGRFGCAGPLRLAVNQYGTGPTLAFAASVFRPGEIEMLTQHAEERSLRVGVNGEILSVNDKAETAHSITTSEGWERTFR